MDGYRFKYGQGEIDANIPFSDILTPPHALIASDFMPLIRDALQNPLGSPPLHDIVSSGDSVAIVASDTTRLTASHIFLPIIVEELNAAGVDDDAIDIIIALGIHRRQTSEEHRRLLGAELCERIRPMDHDAHDSDSLVFYGSTSRGTEVAVNRAVAEADKVIVTGAVSPHYFAGFGGGRKSIMPGVCSLEANLQSHLLVFKPSPDSGRNPNVRVAHLRGNPVHEDMLEAARLVGPDFMLNTIVTPDKSIAAVFAGDFVKAHEAACKRYLESFTVVVPEQADLVVVSAGGYPKDINFIQAHKAIHSAYSAVKPGGWMIVLAQCRDGLGHPDFIDWFRFDNAAEFERKLRANYHIYGQTAYATFEKSSTINIALVSDLNPSDVKRMGIHPAASFEEAYQMAVRDLGTGSIVYGLPSGSNTLLLSEDEQTSALASLSGDTTDG